MCSYENSVLLYPAKNKKRDKVGSYACSSFDHGTYPNIYFCPICKNGFLETLTTEDANAVVEQGHQLYADVEDDVYIANLEARYVTYKKLINKHSELFKDKEILEIGAYYGVFYHEVRDVAKNYHGLEPSQHACHFLKEKYQNINIINNNLETAISENSFVNNKFDVIVMWDVIEHLPNPIKTLREVNALLKDDGKIIFSTINIESSFSMVLGPFWPWFMDMHYYYFSDRGYVDMLHRSGYVIKGHYHFGYYVYLSYLIQKVLMLTLKINLKNNSFVNKLKQNIPIKLGDTVMVVGKKESFE